MGGFKRTDRIADEVKRIIAELLARDLRDPRIGFVTVMDVEMSTDLSMATVWIVVGEGEAADDALAGLKAATGFIRRRLGENLRLRHVPEIRFRYDESIEHGFRIDALLKQLADERDDD